jgi:thiamine monophosphate synthase
MAAGAHGVAMIRAVLAATDPYEAAQRLHMALMSGDRARRATGSV